MTTDNIIMFSRGEYSGYTIDGIYALTSTRPMSDFVEEYARSHCPEDVKPVVRLGGLTSWRSVLDREREIPYGGSPIPWEPFVKWLVARAYIKPVEFSEIWVDEFDGPDIKC